jgi:hypothetical protein
VASCTKEDNIREFSSKEMSFTAGSSPSTKTQYDNADPWQINWIQGDQITIFCDQAGNKQQATYDVTPIAATPHRGTISLALSESLENKKESRTGLRWKEGKHNVYAVYPSLEKNVSATNNIVKTAEGRFTFNFPALQYCSKENVTIVNGNYMLVPDMNLAYMVAKNENLDPLTNVELLFKPVATTLEVTLQGKSVQDLRAGDEADLTNILIKSLDITIKDNNKYIKSSNGAYQIQFDATKDFYNVNSLLPYNTGSTKTAKFTIKIQNDSIMLGVKESVTFTVFLPPIDNLQNVEAKFNIASGSANNTITILADGVKYGSKRRITLPEATEYPFSSFLQKF